MSVDFNIGDLVFAFQRVEFLNFDYGYIVWRRGTGDNVELLHIRAYEHRKGHGTALVRAMVDKLRKNPPYHTVFGFTRVSNEGAHAFYSSLGFTLTETEGVYKDGKAVVFSQPFEDLLKRFPDEG